MANLDFPHQSTADQWFSESQFESYRSLGFEIMEDMLDRAFKHEPYATEPTLDNLLITLRSKAIGSITGRAVMQSEQEATA
jgi:hypothetical protein